MSKPTKAQIKEWKREVANGNWTLGLTDFVSSGKIADEVRAESKAKIRKGDTVRIIYAGGGGLVTLKMYPVEFTFAMVGHTRGYMLPAENEDDALLRAQNCIGPGQTLDDQTYNLLGGNQQGLSWNTDDGSDHNYEIDADGIGEQEEE